MRHVAGAGTSGFGGDGGPATLALLRFPSAIAVSLDGSVYFGDGTGTESRIRRVTSDGLIQTVGGGGGTVTSGSVRARAAVLVSITNIRVAADGTIYFAHAGLNNTGGMFRLTADGWMRPLGAPSQPFAIAPDNAIYFSEGQSRRIYRISPDRTTFRVEVGSTSLFQARPDGDRPENTPVNATTLAVGPDGLLYFGDVSLGSFRIRRVASPFPGSDTAATVLPSEDGSELHVFSREGRHLETRDALTGGTVVAFSYA